MRKIKYIYTKALTKREIAKDSTLFLLAIY